jgi:hypothetical protein
MQKWIKTLVFEKSGNFSPKIVKKIAENCDHNIDPRTRDFFIQSPYMYPSGI